MKKNRVKYVILFIIILWANITFAKQSSPMNVSLAMQAAMRYHDSGEYAAQLAYVAQEATDWFLNRISKQPNVNIPQKLAVVFDIDETLLSNYTIIKTYFTDLLPALSQLHSGKDFIIKYKHALAPTAIPSTQKLYNTVKANRVIIFLISDTQHHDKQYTIKKLHRAGYTGWKKLFLHPDSYFSSSAASYKSAIRKKITDAGYTIIFNIGDQYSDLDGGYAEKCFKLPNPYYLIH